MTTTYQLDFLGKANPKPIIGQMPLWGQDDKAYKSRNVINFTQVNQLFISLDNEEVNRYKNYWESVKPRTQKG